MTLKRALLGLGGLSTVIGTFAASEPIGLEIVCGLIVLGFSLIAVLALTGTFAGEKRREAAQIVLAILLGRETPHSADMATRGKLAISAHQPGAQRGP
jgi:hypothetical protein